ncbi:MAG: hypothetical protein ACOCRO_01935 [Halanaerobiales bacterium]
MNFTVFQSEHGKLFSFNIGHQPHEVGYDEEFDISEIERQAKEIRDKNRVDVEDLLRKNF